MLHTRLLTRKHARTLTPEEKVETRSQSIHDYCRETAWEAQWGQGAGESLPTLQTQTEPLLHAPPPSLPSLRNVLVKVKHVNSEREQRVVALVHCYANGTQIGVLNLALMMPSCFVSQLP